MAILVLIYLLAAPVIQRGTQLSKAAACLANLRSISAAAHTYAGDHNGNLPGIKSTPASDSEPINHHAGEQWDAQIIPYLGIDLLSSNSDIRTVFFCPASTPNTAGPKGRQLSYAWNARLTDSAPYSKRASGLEQASTILMAADNKILGDQPDKNQLLFQSAGNTIYIKEDNTLKRVVYERHNGSANVLFVDGSASPRKPVSTTDLRPGGVRFYNTGPLSPN